MLRVDYPQPAFLHSTTFAMDRRDVKEYDYQPQQIPTTDAGRAGRTAVSGYASNHGTSSAFSVNANPNEDWTKISDLAERRRIQNRIAQRNYRKKLKRRLEDLEFRAASTSASPEQSHADPPRRLENQGKKGQSPRSSNATSRRRRTSPSESSNTSWDMSNSSPGQMHSHPHGAYHAMTGQSVGGDNSGMYTEQLNRQIATSSPPQPFYYATPYSSYQDVYGHHPESYHPSRDALQHHNFQGIPPSHYGDLPGQVPSQHALDPMNHHSLYPGSMPAKHMHDYSDETALNPLCVSYASITGLDMPVHHQAQYDPHLQLTDNNRHRHLPMPTQTGTPRQPPQQDRSANTSR